MGTPGGHAVSEREKQQTLGEVEMAETSKVVAKKRDRAGKGGARSSRRDGVVSELTREALTQYGAGV